MYDVVIIGAGVVGCAIARELSRYKLKILVLEKENDVGSGTSKANTAIVHAGFDAKPGTLKGILNAKSNLLFDKLSEELDFKFERNGSLVLCFEKKDINKLYELKQRGEKNGVPNLEILLGDDVRKIEPNITNEVVAALYAPTGGIVCPFGLTIALAENANNNGVEFRFNLEVKDIKKLDRGFSLIAGEKIIESKVIVNASGIHSDFINNLVSEEKFTVMPRKGEYNLFDKYAGDVSRRTLFQLPTKLGKGVVVSPTVDGNIIVGPSAEDINEKDDFDNTREGLDNIMAKASLSVKRLESNLIITSFTGLRARSDRGDFIIGEEKGVEGFINAAGIESPGLTCAPMIGIMIKDIIIDRLKPEENKLFNPKRIGIKRFSDMTLEEKKESIKNNPSYGIIICRCEMITEGEILEAINRPLGAKDLDGIKRRTRAGAGRCQSGFCISRLMEALNKEKYIDLIDITKFGRKSNVLVGRNKENL